MLLLLYWNVVHPVPEAIVTCVTAVDLSVLATYQDSV